MTLRERARSQAAELRALAARVESGALLVASAARRDGVALRGPLYAQIGGADPCNHRCVMCPYHPPDGRVPLAQFGGRAPGMMTLPRFREVIDDLAALGTRRIDLVGRGEPTLHPSLPALIEHARSRGLEVVLTTNGSRLDAETARALVDAGLQRMKVSLNAGRRETYPRIHVNQRAEDHDRVLEGVARVTARSRVHTTLSFVVSTINAGEVEEMVARVADTGADAAYFQHLIPVPERPELTLTLDDLRRLREPRIPRARALAARLSVETNLASFAREAAAKERGEGEGRAAPCYAGYYFTAILGNDHVMGCCQVERPLGDLNDARFADQWNGEAYRRFRRAARRLPVRGPELETAECERCYFAPHNASIHRLVRPLERSGAALPMAQALRMVRLDGG